MSANPEGHIIETLNQPADRADKDIERQLRRMEAALPEIEKQRKSPFVHFLRLLVDPADYDATISHALAVLEIAEAVHARRVAALSLDGTSGDISHHDLTGGRNNCENCKMFEDEKKTQDKEIERLRVELDAMKEERAKFSNYKET